MKNSQNFSKIFSESQISYSAATSNSLFELSWLKYFVFLLFITFAGCKKDQTLQTESLITATQNNSATNEFLEQVKLNSTNSKIENRSEVYMNISDGFALINDALNLNYCRPKDEYESTISFKDSFNIAVGPSNNISQSNLIALFNQIAQKAGEHFYGVQDPTKATFMFDVRQADNISNNNMPIYVYFMMTKGSCNSPVNYPYGANEGWGYGNNTGRCDYTDPGFDAADIFRCDLRKNLCYKNKQAAYYYTDRYSVCFGMFNDFCQSFDINYLTSGFLTSLFGFRYFRYSVCFALTYFPLPMIFAIQKR